MPKKLRQQFSPIYTFLWHKWYFDELYNVVFVQPVLFISRRIADFDRKVIDRLDRRLRDGGARRFDDRRHDRSAVCRRPGELAGRHHLFDRPVAAAVQTGGCGNT